MCSQLSARIYRERVLLAASGAICSGNQRSLPTIRADFPCFDSKIAEHWRYLPAGEHWPEWLVIYQQTEQVEARQWSEHIASIFQQLQLVLDPIDWQGHGRGAYIFSNDIEVGAIADFHTLEPQQILDRVRIHLVAHAANAHAGTSGRDPYLITWLTPEAEMESLCRVRLDDVDQGISIAEYIRKGRRVYAYFDGPINT